MSAIVVGSLLSLLGLLGLVLAAGSIDTGMCHFGLALFAVCVGLDRVWVIMAVIIAGSFGGTGSATGYSGAAR